MGISYLSFMLLCDYSYCIYSIYPNNTSQGFSQILFYHLVLFFCYFPLIAVDLNVMTF